MNLDFNFRGLAKKKLIEKNDKETEPKFSGKVKGVKRSNAEEE